ncbi:hypothetical protein MTR_4g127520 [Medicago truncatula]|uniref:Uncharacterized protein n=1 Tax=Medicago truncatula TaxID=3880 RepID=G7JUB5_MEDTR|nr:hypothetical protein MTR_4g127520 [Medicago truncatula]
MIWTSTLQIRKHGYSEKLREKGNIRESQNKDCWVETLRATIEKVIVNRFSSLAVTPRRQSDIVEEDAREMVVHIWRLDLL